MSGCTCDRPEIPRACEEHSEEREETDPIKRIIAETRAKYLADAKRRSK